jgi:ABC-type antimicrobial peptide transport system permease subunit
MVDRDTIQHVRHWDWKLASLFGYVFGLISLLIGIYMYLYYETDWIGWIGLTFYSYRNYAIPLVIAGIILFILGYITERRDKTKKKAKETTTDIK